MAIPQSMLDADAQIQELIDRLVAQSSGRLDEIMRAAVDLIESNILAAAATTQGVGGASFASVVARIDLRALGALLAQAGYEQFQIDIQEEYRELLDEVASTQYSHLVEVLPDLGGLSIRAVNNALESDLVEFQRIGLDLTRRLKGTLEQMTLAPISLDAAAASLAASTTTSLRQAKTLVNTGLASLQRRLHVGVANEIEAQGVEILFLYMGPIDKVTRPFCRRLAGKTLTREQLGKLDNGSGLSVVTSAGGWNCRHDLLPISPSMAKIEKIPRVDNLEGLTG